MEYFKLTGLAIAISVAFVPQAYACQGPQFETNYIYYSSEPITDIPDGMMQIKVNIDTDQRTVLHGDGSHYPTSDYAKVQMITDDQKARNIALKTPYGLTSCDNITWPVIGEQYIVGVFAKGHGLHGVNFGRRPLFIHYPISRHKNSIFGPNDPSPKKAVPLTKSTPQPWLK